MTNMWMVRAGKSSLFIDDFKKLNVVAIGWELGDLTNKTPDDIKKLVKKNYSDNSNQTNGKISANIIKFCHEIKVGDYVLSYNSWTHQYLLGKITSDYYYDESLINDEFSDLRNVEWLCKIPKDNLKKTTQTTLSYQMTVFDINEDAQRDILSFYENARIKDKYYKSAKIIRDYLDENNLGNFENEDYERAYTKFREDFAPEILENLTDIDVLNTIFIHDSDKNTLCSQLEFSDDYKFAGSISGGSAHKFSLFKHSQTQKWTAGAAKNSKNVSEEEAIEIAEKIRDAIVSGARLIKKSELTSINDYIQLEIDLGEIFSDCMASHTNMWIHKYYSLIFPDKFPVVHWDKMKKELLETFNIAPEDWYYTLDGQLMLLARKAGIKGYSLFRDEILNLFKSEVNIFESKEKRNIIYFGAPGTGKSYNLNQDKKDLLKDFNDNYERVTFHPDYSYANFVGTYKPVPDGDSITYDYVPGPFMRILKKSIENPSEPFLLIIEEINRANVAAVFGDVFQLLDRDENYESEYSIETSEDMRRYLNRDKIKLPQNLFIWATMNSADQGVFPMDTAFKRRWDFKYFSINHNENLIKDTHVIINDKPLYWNDLRKRINDELLSYNLNEDKLIGPFFAFTKSMNEEIEIDSFKDIFKNKIIMYLFEDAARSRRNQLFSGACNIKDTKNITYFELCELIDEDKITEIFSNDFLDDEEEDNE